MMRRILGLDEFTGWHMLGVLILFFGTIISVNITLAVFAAQSWTGLVVKNSYVASQHFNEDVAAQKARDSLGWTAQLHYREDDLALALKDGAGDPLYRAEITVTVGRPAHERDDRTLALAAESDGLYHARTTLGPGLWDAKIIARASDGTEWADTYRFRVEQPE